MSDHEDFDIQEHITLHAVTNGTDQTGWIHTHGMDKLGCPDLEIRGVPLFFVSEAATLLNHVAAYMVALARSGKDEIRLGQTMSTAPSSTFRFIKLDPISGDEDHFEHERWALSDDPMRGLCDDCAGAARGCDEPGCSGETLN